MAKMIDVVNKQSNEAAKALGTYYDRILMDSLTKNLVYDFPKNIQKPTKKQKLLSLLEEGKRRLYYAIEALKGNYGCDDYDY